MPMSKSYICGRYRNTNSWSLAGRAVRIWDRTFLRLHSSNTREKNDVGRALSPVVAALIAVSSVPVLLGQTPDAAQIMASAREALGGEKKLSAVRSFVATGRTRQVRGNNLVPIEFEINCELPDKFVRKDEIPAQDTDPTTRGFNGDTLIQVPPPGAGRGGPRAGGPGPGGPPPGGAARAGGPPPAGGRGPGGPPVPPIVAVKQDFARLMLGLFAGAQPGYPDRHTKICSPPP